MTSFLYLASRRCLPWSCLIVGAGWLFAAASGYGQATVTLNAGVMTSSRTDVATATFTEVVPATFAATTYTYTPLTGTNGTLTLAGLTAGNATTSGSFVAGSVSGQYSTPDTTSGTYLAIGGSQRPGPISLTFSNAATNYFGLEWATPDAYNSVKLTFKDGTMATYTPGVNGFALAANGGNSFVEFSASQPITGVSLSSTSAAFELDNIAYGVVVVPEPATWAMGGLTALAGAAVLRRRRASSK